MWECGQWQCLGLHHYGKHEALLDFFSQKPGMLWPKANDVLIVVSMGLTGSGGIRSAGKGIGFQYVASAVHVPIF